LGIATFGWPARSGLGADPAAPAPVDASADQEAALNLKVEAALEKRGDWEYVDTPLSDVAAHLSDMAAVPVLLDRKSLEEIGVEVSTPVTISLQGVRLRSLLVHLADPLELAWHVSQGAVWITTPEACDEHRLVCVYSLRELFPAGASVDELDYDSIIAVVTSVIAPETWDHVGGSGSITYIQGKLVISQLHAVQHEIRLLLDQLRQLAELHRLPQPVPSAPLLVEPVADNARVRAALEQPITLEFADAHMWDVAGFLCDARRIPVLLDAKALEDMGVSPSDTVTINASELPLRIALRRILDELELTYVVREEALVFTTPEESEAQQLVVIYPVGDLLPSPHECEWLSDDDRGYDALIQTITSTVLQDSWDVVGGASSVAALPILSALVVTHSEEGHRQIQELFRALRAIRVTPVTDQEAATTSDTAADLRLEVYRLNPAGTAANPPVSPEQIAKLICQIIEPDSWHGDRVVDHVGNQLVVRHTPQVHRRIDRLLDRLGLRELHQGGGMAGAGLGGGFFQEGTRDGTSGHADRR
jgi:hypothetical protein